MHVQQELINWYHAIKRDLPWRHTTDAYTIWLSEIILQQTRVEQGLPYYQRFLEKYPTVIDFAAAPEDDILKLWQGLGYYSRGRNMLKTAKQVQEEYNGVFPTSYDQLIKLKGIGEYTAAAISSFSANEARAVLDGNVYRVLSRYLGISQPIDSTTGKKIFRQAADDFLNEKDPAAHNQAMMELGALVCKPKNPACGTCPIRMGCYAFLHNAAGSFPVKAKKIKVKERFFNYFLFEDENGRILMNKRSDNDIWANMYDLPLIETTHQLSMDELIALPEVVEIFGKKLIITKSSPIIKHVLTHQHLYVRFVVLKQKPLTMHPNWVFIEVENLKKIALPKVIFIFLDNFLN
ncbi:A/G-specific adenine glycosylase [Mucilaginibacter auburnensis]|uniref:Adenine DNA glycosylase n=1 Tax=Mucilaginibacter auburnensis TaxID=1457233 RepID=A0A2H9VQ49_9SPHI|nr:A/G-specific adenine glycosylase [Mucilaginibacter auburnensis]PJJ80489.1 A/G-specific adenine glycosylase [Mucilaginibacter auburnensis]